MKRITTMMALLAILTMSCQEKLVPANEVKYLGAGTNEISLESKGYGSKEEIARQDPIKRAINVVLFQGIPGAGRIGRDAMVKAQTQEKHKAFFNGFFEGGKYLDFVPNSSILSSVKDKGKYTTVVSAKINMSAMRKYLETNGVIRGFGL